MKPFRAMCDSRSLSHFGGFLKTCENIELLSAKFLDGVNPSNESHWICNLSKLQPLCKACETSDLFVTVG